MDQAWASLKREEKNLPPFAYLKLDRNKSFIVQFRIRNIRCSELKAERQKLGPNQASYCM